MRGGVISLGDPGRCNAGIIRGEYNHAIDDCHCRLRGGYVFAYSGQPGGLWRFPMVLCERRRGRLLGLSLIHI